SLIAFGDQVGLFVIDHLQPVFHLAQKAIGRLELRPAFGLDLAKAFQGGKRLEGCRDLQGPLATAGDQLMDLGEEFHLADTAAAELHVLPRDGDLAVAVMAVNLSLDAMDILNRGEIQMPPPDEALDAVEEVAASGTVAGHGPRL